MTTDPWAGALHRAAAFQLAAAMLTLMFTLIRGDDGLPYHYFLTEDLPALVVGGIMLALLPQMRGARAVGASSRRHALAVAFGAAVIAYAGATAVLHHYALSRDEQMADLGAAYLAQGRLGLAFPDALRPLARAMVPQFAAVYPDSGVWVSGYLPVNSAFRAIGSWFGDCWLASPALLLAGLIGLWSAARRIWPQQPHAATVALMLAASSTQLLVTAMSPFAMTGHFALNALWLACFLRGDTRGRIGAVVLTFLAVGLHQAHFHLMFLGGFLIVLAARRRWGELMLYAAAAVAAYLLWEIGYRSVVEHMFGAHPAAVSADPVVGGVMVRLMRVLGQDVLRNFARFVAWQNVLLVPLAVIGVAALRRARADAILACALSCLIGMVLMPAQEHGFGYRYMHGLIGPFCLLAAQGWLEIERRRGRAITRTALFASVGFALLVTLPWLGWRSMAYAAPYEAAYRAVRDADVDYVLVDTTPQTYISDIVRFDLDVGPMQRPIVADIAQVPADALARLCRQGKVAVFGWPQMQALGIRPFHWDNGRGRDTAARLTQLRALRCGRPLAVTPG